MHYLDKRMFGTLRQKPALDIEQRLVFGRSRQYILWFIDNDDRRVFVDDVDVFLFGHPSFGRRSAEHIAEYRAALLDAARIELQMHAMQLMHAIAAAVGHLRRYAIPELCHGNRLELVDVGILKQAGSRTFSCSSRRQTSLSVLKDVDDIAVDVMAIHEVEAAEYPFLQSLAPFLAFAFE